jgi:hypothetical protein
MTPGNVYKRGICVWAAELPVSSLTRLFLGVALAGELAVQLPSCFSRLALHNGFNF